MALKLEIFLINEKLDDISSLEDFVTELGDVLVKYNFGNTPVGEELQDSLLENIKSYMLISEGELLNMEDFNLRDCILVIPVNTEV